MVHPLRRRPRGRETPIAAKRTASTAVAIQREPWERQPGETSPAFAAFALYRDLGGSRTIRRAAEIHAESTRRNIETVYSGFKVWASKWDWHTRCEEYDVIVDRRMREARESEWERREQDHASLFRSLQLRAALRVVGGEMPGGQKIDAAPVEELSLMDAARVLDLAVKGERVANGKPADLLRGAMVASAAEVSTIVRQVVEALFVFIPEESHEQAVQALEAIWRRR